MLVRVWKASRDSDGVITPEVLIKNIRYLERQEIVIKKGVYKGLASQNPKDVRGSTYEVELGTEIQKRSDRGDVLYLDKSIKSSDGDVWVDQNGDGQVDVIIEAKNLDLKSDTYYGDVPPFLFKDPFVNKIQIWKSAIRQNKIPEVEIKLSLRTTVDDLPETVLEGVREAEKKTGTEIELSKDEDYVTDIRIIIRSDRKRDRARGG